MCCNRIHPLCSSSISVNSENSFYSDTSGKITNWNKIKNILMYNFKSYVNISKLIFTLFIIYITTEDNRKQTCDRKCRGGREGGGMFFKNIFIFIFVNTCKTVKVMIWTNWFFFYWGPVYMYMTIVSLYYKSLFQVVKLENIMACMYTSYHIPQIYLYVEEVCT